ISPVWLRAVARSRDCRAASGAYRTSLRHPHAPAGDTRPAGPISRFYTRQPAWRRAANRLSPPRRTRYSGRSCEPGYAWRKAGYPWRRDLMTAKPGRCKSGISGLDEVLFGGLIAERLYLVDGNPGAGKTTLAMQFLMEGARSGVRCLYVTLSETALELHAAAASHGWNLDGIDIVELI